MLGNLSFSAYLHSNPLLLLALIAHFLADFQWQSQKMAEKKASDRPTLLKHLFIVSIPLFICISLVPSAWHFLLAVLVSHCIIDSGKFYLNPKLAGKKWDRQVFIIDQLLHYVFIFAAYLLAEPYINRPSWLFAAADILCLIFLLVLITKPINIVFKLFFSKYQVQDEDDATITGAGALIGLLERLIMALFLISGQYASIGLVFTAKSIARYDKISKNQAFAEYYLIGSLFSIISVLICYELLYYL